MTNTPNLIIDDKGSCPRCNADWKGWEIPEEDRHLYAAPDAEPSTYPTHGSRLIGLEDRDIYDGCHSHQCPDCKAIFPRIMYYHAKWKLKMLAEGKTEQFFHGTT